MIEIASIRDIAPTDFEEIWAIVRSLKSKSSYLKHVPELSPVPELFFWYRSMAAKGQWTPETFDTVYRPRFLRDIEQSAEAQAKLQELIDKHNVGKRIALVCFCPKADTCHRKLIGEILAKRSVPFTLR